MGFKTKIDFINFSMSVTHQFRYALNEECRLFLQNVTESVSSRIDSAAGSTEYIPTQILSELFKSLGLDAVGYRSALHDGYNVALFNVDMAEMVDCQLFDTKRIDYEFSEVSTVFRAPECEKPR